jgi:uncharacterized UBP type Zn finger protein
VRSPFSATLAATLPRAVKVRHVAGRSGTAVDSPASATEGTGVNACTHLDQSRDVEPSTPEGCTECLAMGSPWVHLRKCLSCGHVGCCDSSPNKHATAHFGETGHPVVQSFQPGEHWRWCYVDQMLA